MSATATELSRQLRLLLQSSLDAPPLDDVLQLVDDFVLECSSSCDLQWQVLLQQLEDELQTVYEDSVVDYAEAEILISVLYHLRPILPPPSIISTWFDLVLRPALRQSKQSASAVDHAKKLIIAALYSDPVSFPLPDGTEEEKGQEIAKRKEKVGNFRRRLMDLYLLDAFNESSGEDVLEWVELTIEQREQKACWKLNLEDVLVRFGLERPQDFLTELYHCFGAPSSRLQLLILLNSYISRPKFPNHAAVLAAHPLVFSILYSVLFDNSSTECTMGLTVMTKLLPIFAVKSPELLKSHLPLLLTALARIICWRERLPKDEDEDSLRVLVNAPPVREDIGWVRLEQSFEGSAATPSPHRFFTFLYYLFPCNTIRFLRYPVMYLTETGVESVYIVNWERALDEAQIRSKSEVLLRGHVLHPLLIWRGAADELAQPEFWAQYDIPRIIGDAMMLDVRNVSLGMRERVPSRDHEVGAQDAESEPEEIVFSPPAVEPPEAGQSHAENHAAQAPPPISIVTAPEFEQSGALKAPYSAPPPSPSHSLTPTSAVSAVMTDGVNLSGKRIRISLQDMIATSVALKSGLDIEIVDPSPAWSSRTQRQRASSHSPSADVPTIAEEEKEVDGDTHQDYLGLEQYTETEDVPSHVKQAISGLQREVILLRNELNFELWMTRENVKHIGRLYEDRVLSKTAEAERQGLHNKLREYKAENSRLQRELRELKDTASTMKNQYADWNKKLQDKVSEFRKEKHAWTVEATAMRRADKELRDTYAAKDKLLVEARNRVFELQTRIKENAPKIDRLRDYETQIEQLIKLQRLWEVDVQKLNEQAEYLQIFTSRYRKMELKLDSYEKTQAEYEENAAVQRQQVKTLETRLALAQQQLQAARKRNSLGTISQTPAEVQRLTNVNEKLRDENAVLHDEIEELKAMVEILKAQVSERPSGLVFDPRPFNMLSPRASRELLRS